MKNDTNTEGDETMREPLLEVQPVPVPVPVAVDAEAMPLPMTVPEAIDDVEAYTTTSTLTQTLTDTNTQTMSIDIDESEWEHGEVQPKTFRDCFWAVLFLLHFCVVLTLSVMGIVNSVKHGSDWLPSSSDSDDNSGDEDFERKVVYCILILLVTVVAVPSLLLNLLLGAFSTMLIQISLVFSPLSFFIAFIVAFVTMNCPVALFSLIMCVVGIYYAVSVWHKVPFAAANLNIALASIKDNHGLWIIAYLTNLMSYIWITLWGFAIAELLIFSPEWIYDGHCSDFSDDHHYSSDDSCTLSTRGKFIGLGMLLSLYWTSQVIFSIFHTTIAGVVGTWWFDPQEARSASARGEGGCLCSCGCSPAIWNSWIRSGVYSLGSIALGSLLVGIFKVLRFFVRCGRQQRDQQRRMRGIEGTDFLFCLLQFVLDHLERLLQYVNTWAYVYVGLYGYDYWTAGKQVGGLFKARGWEVIINDNLVLRSLTMMSVFIMFITGLVGLLLGFIFLGFFGAGYGLWFGVLLGGSSCQVLFGVVTSAVNTVVVCFAESPNQLLQNGHDPKHFSELVDAYRKAYPNDCGF